MRGEWLLSSGNDGNGEGEEGGKEVRGVGREREKERQRERERSRADRHAPLLTRLYLLNSSQITFRRADYLPHSSLPKCQIVLSRPHKIVGQ